MSQVYPVQLTMRRPSMDEIKSENQPDGITSDVPKPTTVDALTDSLTGTGPIKQEPTDPSTIPTSIPQSRLITTVTPPMLTSPVPEVEKRRLSALAAVLTEQPAAPVRRRPGRPPGTTKKQKNVSNTLLRMA